MKLLTNTTRKMFSLILILITLVVICSTSIQALNLFHIEGDICSTSQNVNLPYYLYNDFILMNTSLSETQSLSEKEYKSSLTNMLSNSTNKINTLNQESSLYQDDSEDKNLYIGWDTSLYPSFVLKINDINSELSTTINDNGMFFNNGYYTSNSFSIDNEQGTSLTTDLNSNSIRLTGTYGQTPSMFTMDTGSVKIDYDYSGEDFYCGFDINNGYYCKKYAHENTNATFACFNNNGFLFASTIPCNEVNLT